VSDSSAHVVAGLDVGGTKILGRAVLSDAPDQPLVEVRVDTPQGTEAVLDALESVVNQLAQSGDVSSNGGLRAVGVGVPGLVDERGVLRFAPNLPGVTEVPIGPDLSARLSLPVTVDNDANCATWCEFSIGAAAHVDDAILITLGTGIGAGIVTAGRLHRGGHGFAGEPGHMVIDPVGPPCPCGRRGCWERFASGSGLGRLGRDAAEAGRSPRVAELAGGDPVNVRGEHVTRAAIEGDAAALEVIREFAWWFAAGVANLVDILDPEIVVVGGGLADAGELLLVPAREAFRGLVLAPDHRPEVPIVAARYGPEAGAIGAGLLAAQLPFHP
jgi:glucokinase